MLRNGILSASFFLQLVTISANVLLELKAEVYWPVSALLLVVVALAENSRPGPGFTVISGGNVRITGPLPGGPVNIQAARDVTIRNPVPSARPQRVRKVAVLILLMLVLIGAGWWAPQGLVFLRRQIPQAG